MRKAFVSRLIKEAKSNSNILLLTADLGFEVFEDYISQFPNRFINVGVAEANMISMAAGLSSLGFVPVCYSISSFLIYKTFEQIRNDVCYPNLNVKIVGVGTGFTYSVNGPSHHGLEDISLTSSLPNIQILSPADPLETQVAVSHMLKHKGPFYLRLGKKGEPLLNLVSNTNPRLNPVKIITQGSGELAIFTTGVILEEAIKAVTMLNNQRISATLIHIPVIKPLDTKSILRIIKKHKKIATIEEHSIFGGLGSQITLVNSSLPKPRSQLTIGVQEKYYNTGGSASFLRAKAKLNAKQIAQRIVKWL